MNALTQPQPATEGQTKQISRVAEDAAANAVKNFTMSKEGAQRVHSNGGEFANGQILETIKGAHAAAEQKNATRQLEARVFCFKQGHATLWQKENSAEHSLNQVPEPKRQHEGHAGTDVFSDGV